MTTPSSDLRNSGQRPAKTGQTDSLVVEPRDPSPMARAAKVMARPIFFLLVSWRLALYRLMSAVGDKEAAFAAASESVAMIPGVRGVYSRQAFYRATLAACGQNVYFGWQTVLSKSKARIGDGVYLGRRCSLGLVDIGSSTMLADGVQVLSGGAQHGHESGDSRPYKDRPQTFHRVRIGENAWIGTNAIVMADVGDSTIIGAGAVVTRPIPAQSLATGVPAKVQRNL